MFAWLSLAGFFFVDTLLPFDSRSSPSIFNSFADLLLLLLLFVGGISGIFHYIDNFFIPSGSARECQDDMVTMVSLYSGVPLAVDKTVGLSQVVSKLTVYRRLFACLQISFRN